MKQTRLQNTLIAAMMTFAASAAFGQEDPMTTKIPFPFRAVGSALPAGRYMASTTREGSGTIALVKQGPGKKVFIPSSAPILESKAEKPRLIFRCGGEEGCSLARLWSGTGRGMEFPTPKLTANQRE